MTTQPTPLIALATEICWHMNESLDPCNDCIERAGEYLAPQRVLKADLRALATRWRAAADELDKLADITDISIEQSETLRSAAAEIERKVDPPS